MVEETMRKFRKTCQAAALLAIAAGGGAFAVLPARAQQGSQDLDVIEVQPNFYMIAGAGGNIGVHLGPAGIILVDTGSAGMSDKILAALKKLSDKPIRYIFNTSADADHVGGNAVLSKAGVSILAGAVGNPAFGEDVIGNGGAASVFAHDNVMARMSAAASGTETRAYPVVEWPTKTYTSKFYTMSLNGEGIEVIHQPAAHSDGDSFVLFRRSNVIVTGDFFDPTHFPVIESDKGGSIQGELEALNHLLELTIPPYPLPWQAERTFLIPGHGPISDSQDLLEYRDMVTIVRDVVQDMISQGMTLEQVKAANPTKGYNVRYGVANGPWTTEMFVTAVYKGLSGKAQ
jgi:glyoxylase-like metal-dependent hydrolase (beta-lactamase superfamily II)